MKLRDAVERFLLSRRVGNCTTRTIEIYAANLRRFVNATPDGIAACTVEVVQQYLKALQERLKPISVHQHYRTLKTFFGWGVEIGLLLEHPMRGLKMKLPKTLPHVPEKDWVRSLLAACPNTFEGIRNKALIALLVDSGLRISEALGLRIGDLNFAERTINVRTGKGQKDSLAFFDAAAREAQPEIPESLNDRAADGWEPLLAIADAAGNTWPLRAREAAVALHSDPWSQEETPGLTLLRAIREIFTQQDTKKIPTEKLISELTKRDSEPWGEWWGHAVSGGDIRGPGYRLARLLKPFGIAPRTVKIGEMARRGFLRTDFEDAFSRYLPPARGGKFSSARGL